MKHNYTDIELLEGLANGDTDAIQGFYLKFHPILTKWMVSRGGSSVDAEDIFQDALMVVYEKSKSDEFKLTCQLGTYLFAICKRLWFKKLKLNGQTNLVEDFNFGFPQEDERYEQDIEEIIKKEKKLDKLEIALDKLGEPCKSILKAYYEKNKSMQEIAEEFNYTNAANAKNQKYKCINRLKKYFFNLNT